MQLNDAVAPLLCYGYRRYFAASSDPLRMATIRTTARALRFFSPSDLNDHIFKASRVFIQHFAPVFADHDGVRVSNASPVGIVDSRLAAESHALLEDGLVAFGDPQGFVEALGVVGWLADDERPLALDGIAAKLARIAEDERIPFLEAVLARDGMRKSGALPERHQASERRINAYADDVFQLGCHLVGERVGGGFQDFVFANSAMRMHEVAAGLNGEVVEKHAAAHDVDFVFVLDITHLFDQVAGFDHLGVGCAELDLLHPARGRLFYTDAGLGESAAGNALEDPAHAAHRPWIVEVRLVVP